MGQSRITLVVALIGVIGTLGAALIANWDKVFPLHPQPTPQPTAEPIPAHPQPTPQPTAEPILNLSGRWHDSKYPNNGSRITQDGNNFHFTGWGELPNGNQFESSGGRVRFESEGSGVITGRHFTSIYKATYKGANQYGVPFQGQSTGSCSGTITKDGMQMEMEMDCNDSQLGPLSATAIRE